ncbi:MAG: adenylate/guanylate cyclase domain-containing protein, partial [Acidimicrobiales bacterium]
RWQLDGRAMADALAAHDGLIRSVVERLGGMVVKHTGDGMCAVFVSAPAAVAAAIEAQAGLELPVRMGLHTGEAESRDGDYFGPAVNRAARVMDAGHGGQVLVSSATAGLVQGQDLVDLGEHQLKGLAITERIFQVGQGQFPALRTPRPMVGNLPVELSTFVGRSHEVKSLVEELDDHRLITLIGVGGTGKTRLAVETGMTVSASFPDGCWMVELAAVMVDDAVPFAFSSGLGMTAPRDGDVIDHLLARLRHKRLLVVVDNCEHVLAAAASAVERIVAGCPGVAVLATSREPLMVRGERLMPVPSLLPEDAERLFLQRARDEAPDLVIDDVQRSAVIELCQRLDGLPLALELAASRVRALTPVELVSNLEERFRMLVGGRRSRMERHQTMRGTLDWSYDLCSEVERAVFDRLSVFPAGLDLPAARAVAAGEGVSDLDVVDVVPHLIDRSLLQRFTASDGTTRYRMLETMRAYGREHLQHQGVADTTRARHAHYMAATIGALGLRTLGPDEHHAIRRINEYLPDALVALDWCIDHQDWENGLRVTTAGDDLADRESAEMIVRLHDAAQAGGASTEVLDELELRDVRNLLFDTVQQSTERGWRMIRAHRPVPSDRASIPPHLAFGDGGLAAADIDEFLGGLDEWRAAPPVNRFLAEVAAIRSLAHNGHLDAIAEPLDRLTAFVAQLHSPRARRWLAELNGTAARTRHDWVETAHWYAKVTQAGDGRLHTWLDLAAAWHLLTARCLCPGAVDITSAELREPWECLRNEHLETLGWHGATSTALALQRLGRTPLADRFANWVYRNDPGDNAARTLMSEVLEIAGLPTAQVDGNDDLDTLIDELFAVADELDHQRHSSTASRKADIPGIE